MAKIEPTEAQDDADDGSVEPTDYDLDERVWLYVADTLEQTGKPTKIKAVLEALEGVERDGLPIRRPELKWALYRLYQAGLLKFLDHSSGSQWTNEQKADSLKGQTKPGSKGYLSSVTVASPKEFLPSEATLDEQYAAGPVPNKPQPIGVPRKAWKGTPIDWIAKGAPLTVAYGAGVDSTAVLVEFVRLGLRPELILFADLGAEKPETMAYLPIMDAYLKKHRFPPITRVRYELTEAGKKARLTRGGDSKRKQIDPRPYTTITENLVYNRTLPSLAYGFQSHACSSKWKVVPQEAYITDGPFSQRAREAWAQGLPVIRTIGFDASPGDKGRRNRIPDTAMFLHWYPLQDWGWDRIRCKEEIRKAGLPVPMKSACFFCPSTHPWEIQRFVLLNDPFVKKICEIEDLSRPFNQSGLHQGLWFVGDKLPEPIRARHPYQSEYWFESGKLTPEEMDYFIEVKWGGLPDYNDKIPGGRKNLGRSGTKPGRMCDFIQVFKRFCKQNPKHKECRLQILESTMDAHLFRPNPVRPREPGFPDPYLFISEGQLVSYHDNPVHQLSNLTQADWEAYADELSHEAFNKCRGRR